MICPAACALITMVANAKPVWNLIICECPCDAVSFNMFASQIKKAVPLLLISAVQSQHGLSMCGIVGQLILSTLLQNLASWAGVSLISFAARGRLAVASFIVRLWIELAPCGV